MLSFLPIYILAYLLAYLHHSVLEILYSCILTCLYTWIIAYFDTCIITYIYTCKLICTEQYEQIYVDTFICAYMHTCKHAYLKILLFLQTYILSMLSPCIFANLHNLMIVCFHTFILYICLYLHL